MHSRFNQDTAADPAVPAGWIGAILQCWISRQEPGQGCDHRWYCTSKVSHMDAEHLSCFSRIYNPTLAAVKGDYLELGFRSVGADRICIPATQARRRYGSSDWEFDFLDFLDFLIESENPNVYICGRIRVIH